MHERVLFLLLCAALGIRPGLAAGLGHGALYVFVLAPLIEFSVRRREFDPAWLVIRALAVARLVVVGGASARLS